MAGMVRALAADLDGTLAHGERVDERTRLALQGLRDRGVFTILVTGRLGRELDRVFPGLRADFDVVVVENGAVVCRPTGEEELLAPPVDPQLVAGLTERGIAFSAGRCILDCWAGDGPAIMAALSDLAIDAVLTRNRDRLMVMPAGATKGTGLLAAARSLRISCHNIVALGDAENDLAMLEAAELGVAVADALPSVKERADLVLPTLGSTGVVEFLTGPIMEGIQPLRSTRRQVELGRYTDGRPVRIPSAQANILIQGGSGTGKSHLAGLLIENWIRLGYSVLVLDVEGDYQGLDQLSDVVVLEGDQLPDNQELVGLLRHRSLSVVIDLSRMADSSVSEYVRGLAGVIDSDRAAWGIPHWIVFDEAHASLGLGGFMAGLLRPTDRGFCLVTFRPQELRPDAAAEIDYTITATGVESHSSRTALIRRDDGPDEPFVVNSRRTPHSRHWHKYVSRPLPPHQWFHFRDSAGNVVASADNMATFLQYLRTVDAEVLETHVRNGDFSRWLVGSLRDRQLAAVAAAVERDVISQHAREIQRARVRLVEAIEDCYGLAMHVPPG